MCAKHFTYKSRLASKLGILGSGNAVTRWPVCTLAYAGFCTPVVYGDGNCVLIIQPRFELPDKDTDLVRDCQLFLYVLTHLVLCMCSIRQSCTINNV